MMIFADGTASLIAQAGLDAGALGHPDVEQHDVGRDARGEVGALDAVAGLADHLDAPLGGQQHRQSAAEEFLVVDDQDPDGLVPGVRSCSSTGESWHVWVTFAGTNGVAVPHVGVARSGHPASIVWCPTRSAGQPPRSSEITP